nr:AraC family transcriptional regulator [Cohnella sp. YIM B05605]
MEDLQYENEEGTLVVSHRKARSHHMPANHFHGSFEIFYLMSGKREFFIQDRTLTIAEGDIVIISPNVLHRTTNADIPEYERLVVNVHERVMASANRAYRDMLRPLFEKEYRIVRCSLQDRLAIEELARGIIRELKERKPGFEMYVQASVLQLSIACCRQLNPDDPEPLLASPSPMHERMSEVARYINQHYASDLSLHRLAERFYVSPYYLSRFFKEATGFTFVEYLNSVRIKEAKKLLESSNLKVGLIAKKAGFGSVTHFGRVFKAVTGHAPLYYRKGK